MDQRTVPEDSAKNKEPVSSQARIIQEELKHASIQQAKQVEDVKQEISSANKSIRDEVNNMKNTVHKDLSTLKTILVDKLNKYGMNQQELEAIKEIMKEDSRRKTFLLAAQRLDTYTVKRQNYYHSLPNEIFYRVLFAYIKGEDVNVYLGGYPPSHAEIAIAIFQLIGVEPLVENSKTALNEYNISFPWNRSMDSCLEIWILDIENDLLYFVWLLGCTKLVGIFSCIRRGACFDREISTHQKSNTFNRNWHFD